jgi:hypothetical protein
VFLYLLFLQLEALVLPGRSLRRQASTLITLYKVDRRDPADAQQDF